ncbi:DHA2 family methylenomycin A resistance protein-like MFS transporter [Kitasatospora sp. MAP12-15]|nr:DHA2 family methylenomycin A resistance protein-like MFS transporter [Kitasatospora sp. MAP12-44]
MSENELPAMKRKLTLLAACLGFVVVILDVSVVNVATDALRRDLGGSISGLEWVINGYTLTFAAFLLTAGAFGDRFDLKRIFQLGFAVFALASFACGASDTLVMLIIARIVQGVGAALIVPSSLALVNQAFPVPAERGKAVSLWAAAGGLSLALGPVVGGILISQLGWQSIFFVNVPIAVAGIWLIGANAPAPKPRTGAARSFDLPGQALAVVGLGTLTAAIIEANGLGWTAPLVLACFAVFVLSVAGFIVVEGRSADPMLPLKLFRNKAFTASSLIGVSVNFSFYGLIFIFSLFFQSVWHYTPIRAGLAFLPMTATIMIANLVSGRLTKRHGARPVLISGSLLAALGYLTMLPAVGSASYLSIALQLLVAGAGIGLVVPAMTNAMLSAVEQGNIGIASGVLNASRQLGGLIGVATMGLLVGHVAGAGFLTGLRYALIAATAVLVLGALLSAVGIQRIRPVAAPAVREPVKPVPAVAECAGLSTK